MRYPFLTGSAVALAAAVLAACGSSSGDGDDGGSGGGRAAGTPPASSGPVAGTDAAPSGPASAGPRPARSSEPPTVPTDRLTPATGTFTEKQKEYLIDRVPVGIDPAAVLETGQETCDRLSYLVKVDPDTAVGAVVTGEVADAAPAVAHLCPRHQEVVDRAALGYADGVHRGAALRPGRYRNVSPTGACSWEVTGRGGKVLDSGSSGDGKRSTLTITEAALAFTSTGCYAWLPEGDNG
ncbi:MULTISPECIES: hypothetical protein [unclassified Streptomyces]|uniref:hypothetical protein n=1 Tax=unclassified Streptomyces TaxID=2593676 RepID=UPI000DAEFF41|nr:MULTISPECIES: hypothetical protein [unclassified Streptomyces]PZT73541.1 hypothetical protein DNK55_14825 [Streptomyces sp. AC1-42T]PZT83466.1 hypothetical protein DNK56_16600 [Streptomyces sp. AC1-42W]